jgi:uncharacterized membrane-anchored protein
MAELDKNIKKQLIGQLVWAKIKGHPWWPGIVSSNRLPFAIIGFWQS